MASEQEVKRYLAYWFQLGKKVVIHNTQTALLPQPVIAGDRYSDEFESIWQQIVSPHSGDCYLEGTEQTIAELLTPRWDIDPCVRCDMPVPLINIGIPPEVCPCNDLPNWPNTEIPAPREPVNSHNRLSGIRDRLSKTKNQQIPGEDISSTLPNQDLPAQEKPDGNQDRLREIRDRLSKARSY
jgi:hypothetical protein